MSESSPGARSLLEEISIRSLGVIDSALVEFGPGLNVITGETGAGKTMLLTALSLVLGGKSDSELVRSGSERTIVTGRFRLPKRVSEEINALLEKHQPELEEGSLLLARQVTSDGKSRGYISGNATNASVLAEFASELIEIHGQHGALSLSKRVRQRELLDSFGGDEVEALLTKYQEAVIEYESMSAKVVELKKALADRSTQIARLEELVAAFEKLKPKIGELDEITAQLSRLESVEDLRLATSGAVSALDGDEYGAKNALTVAKRSLAGVKGKDPILDKNLENLEELNFQLSDLISELSGYLEDLAADPSLLEQLLERRAALLNFGKRFGGIGDKSASYEEAVIKGSSARNDLANLDGGQERLNQFEAEAANLFEVVKKRDTELSKFRISIAERFSAKVLLELRELAMPNAEFKCLVQEGQLSSTNLPKYGSDDIEMMFTAHSGGSLLPISKAASGGELSRLMLAIEVVVSSNSQIGTYLFDEIDAGIGGQAALEVGRRLKKLASSSQVIVVTHLPQVAIWADRHLRVVKNEAGAVTQSSISLVEGDEREREIARMLSGLAESEHAQEHARELLKMGKG